MASASVEPAQKGMWPRAPSDEQRDMANSAAPDRVTLMTAMPLIAVAAVFGFMAVAGALQGEPLGDQPVAGAAFPDECRLSDQTAAAIIAGTLLKDRDPSEQGGLRQATSLLIQARRECRFGLFAKASRTYGTILERYGARATAALD